MGRTVPGGGAPSSVLPRDDCRVRCRPDMRGRADVERGVLHVEVAGLQRILGDEVPARLHLVAHQHRKDVVRFESVADMSRGGPSSMHLPASSKPSGAEEDVDNVRVCRAL